MGLFDKFKETVNYYANNGIDLSFVAEGVAAERYEICKGCTSFVPLTSTCTKCGCFMFFKTKLVYDPIESGRAAEKKLTVCADNRAIVTIKEGDVKHIVGVKNNAVYKTVFDQKYVDVLAFGNVEAARCFVEDQSLEFADIELLRKW